MKKPPYEFALKALAPLETQFKPMFGATAVFHGHHKALMILRKKTPADQNTGVWIGIQDEFIADIKNEFPMLKDLTLFGTPPTPWQVVRESEAGFEETVLKFCALIKKEDPRIGRILKAKQAGKPKLVVPKKIKVKSNRK